MIRRRLFSVAAAISLLVCIWGCTVWVRSFQAGASSTPSTFRMQNRLRTVIPTVRFDAVGITDVVDFCRDISGLNIDANWPALKAAGIDPNAQVSDTLSNVSFGEALHRFLPQAKLGFTADDNLIIIAPLGQTRDIRIVERFPDAPGPTATKLHLRQP